MTILVDPAVWSWRNDRWAHLISDESLDELHEFASRLGRRRFSFQGDHYDIPSAYRTIAIDIGAIPTDARTLARRLRAAGLRLPPSRRPPPWELLHTGDVLPSVAAVPVHLPGTALSAAISRAISIGGWRRMVVGRRPGEVGVMLLGTPADDDAVIGAIDHPDLHVSRPFDDMAAVELFGSPLAERAG